MKGLVAFRKRLNERFQESLDEGKTYDLVVPGKIVSFVPSIEDKVLHMRTITCCSGSSGAAVEHNATGKAAAIYSDPEADFRTIVLSDNLVNEHLTDSIQAVLGKLAKSFQLKAPFYFPMDVDEDVEEA
jgi:hypothetical protein